MEKYIEIMNILIDNPDKKYLAIHLLNAVKSDSAMYEDRYFRTPDAGRDLVWLEMIDFLIEHNYAFEMDWKADYEDAKSGIERLLSNFGAEYQFHGDEHLYPLSAEEFFPEVNFILGKLNFRIFNFDIDSDSYVTAMTYISNQDHLLSLDPRIKNY